MKVTGDGSETRTTINRSDQAQYSWQLKRPQAKELIAGAVASMGSAQMSLALEFASAARPDPGLSNNQGWAENRAPISANETASRLQQERGQWNDLKIG